MVRFAPPLILYVTVALGVPLKVMLVVAPEQTVVVPEIVAVGKGVTVTATLLLSCAHKPIVEVTVYVYTVGVVAVGITTGLAPVTVVGIPEFVTGEAVHVYVEELPPAVKVKFAPEQIAELLGTVIIGPTTTLLRVAMLAAGGKALSVTETVYIPGCKLENVPIALEIFVGPGPVIV